MRQVILKLIKDIKKEKYFVIMFIIIAGMLIYQFKQMF